jgi:2-haloacid dehalogenase
MTDLSQIKALTFDVFGTVVDWRGTLIREGQAFGARKGLAVDWAAFADAFRAGYRPAMDLDDLLVQFDLQGLNEADKDHLNRVWHRLEPWPDAIPGMQRLRQRYILASLSNGNVALLVNMAKRAGLPWDCVLSSELARHYKPDAEVYLLAAQLLGLEPHQVMMVAAHNRDLLAAQAVGMRTAFVLRATEYGPGQTTNLEADPSIDVTAADFLDLAGQLL